MIFNVIQLFLLAISAISDMRKKEISIWLVISMAVISLIDGVLSLVLHKKTVTELAISLIPGVLLVVLSVLSRQSIGYGDGLITMAIGVAFGISKLFAGLAIALFASGVMSIFLIVVRKAKRNDTFPFIPFILAGMVVSMFA